jgi:D-alanyl-D-alanine carboxypeptidase
VTLAALILSLGLAPSAALHTAPEPPPPIVFAPREEPTPIAASAWALYSVDGQTMLWERDADSRRAMASVTKVMTALIVARDADPAAAVAISRNAATTGIGYPGQAQVLEGDYWIVEELLDNLIVQSGNDAAVALAEHTAGSVDAFVDLMNAAATELGMTETSFSNPNGLDAAGHFSTARDLVTLGVAAIDDPLVTRTARIKAVTFDPRTRDPFMVDSTNRLLGSFPGVFGFKTGDTLDAGLVLLSYLDTGTHRFIGVVMNADDHIAATAALLGYAIGAFRPSDHLLAPLIPADVTDVLPDWLKRRLQATATLPDGRERLSQFGATPGDEAVIDAFKELLPAVLGGRA